MNHRSNGKLPPAPKRASNNFLFLFDVDGTLIGPDYLRGRGDFSRFIKNKIIGNQAIFGLNTSRPRSEVKAVFDELGLNGPIIAESGAYFLRKPGSKINLSPQADGHLRQHIVAVIKEIAKDHGAVIMVTDNKKKLEDPSIPILILVTKSRHFSASVYVRHRGKISSYHTNKLFNQLSRLKVGNHWLIGKIADRGKITISNSRSNKFRATELLIKTWFPDKLAVMISDEEEPPVKTKKMVFCSVKNATKEYKKRCYYVARYPGFLGLKEIINKFI